MKTKNSSGRPDNQENSFQQVVDALTYLYEEAIRQELLEVAAVIAEAIKSCQFTRENVAFVGPHHRDLKPAIAFLARFLQLSDTQKKQALTAIEILSEECPVDDEKEAGVIN